MITKRFEVSQKAITADAGVMAAINRFALSPLTAEQVFVGQMKLCNDQYDRQNERLPLEYLQRFAATLPGKSAMQGHDYSLTPDGLFFAAEVAQDETGYYLLAKYYLLVDNPLVPKIKAGIIRFVSIGFTYDKRFCDIDGIDYDQWYYRSEGDDYCHHYRGQEYDGVVCTLTYGGDATKAEALEGSFVWLGAQRGAETMRGGPAAMHKDGDGDALHVAKGEFLTKQRAEDGRKGGVMDPKEKAALEAREKELEQKLATVEAELQTVHKQCAEHEALARDGMAYRAWQAEEVKRLYKSMGQEQTGERLVKRFENAPAAELDEIRKEAETLHAEHFAPVGGGQAKGAPVETVKRSVDELLYGVRPRREGA